MKRLSLMLRVSLVMLLMFLMVLPSIAATTAEVTVTFTPGDLTFTDNVTSVEYGVVNLSTTTNTSTSYIGVDMTGTTIQTDISIFVTNNWTDFTHSDTATPGFNTVGMMANHGNWGTGDVIVRLTAPYNYIYEDLPASTNFTYGLSLIAPTSANTTDTQSNTVMVSGAAG